VDLVDVAAEIAPGVTLVPTLGHTLADTDLLVIGTHFGGVGPGCVVSTDDGHILAATAT
jgi:hypothetical protein